MSATAATATAWTSESAELPVKSYARANRELLASFVRYLEARGMSPTTIQAYREAVAGYAESLGPKSAIEAERTDVRMFLTGLLNRGLCDNTVRLRTAALRAFYKFITLSGITRHNPMLLLSSRKLPGRVQPVLSIEEVERLIAAARNPFERAVVEMLYASGVRVSELVRLQLEDVNWNEAPEPGTALVRKGKGGKDRYALFGRYARTALLDYLAQLPERTAGPLFFASHGGPYTSRQINQLIADLGARAGVEHVYPHALRRACATHMLKSGANIREIMEFLGHERITTTTLYAIFDDTDIREAHRKVFGREASNDGTTHD